MTHLTPSFNAPVHGYKDTAARRPHVFSLSYLSLYRAYTHTLSLFLSLFLCLSLSCSLSQSLTPSDTTPVHGYRGAAARRPHAVAFPAHTHTHYTSHIFQHKLIINIYMTRSLAHTPAHTHYTLHIPQHRFIQPIYHTFPSTYTYTLHVTHIPPHTHYTSHYPSTCTLHLTHFSTPTHTPHNTHTLTSPAHTHDISTHSMHIHTKYQAKTL